MHPEDRLKVWARLLALALSAVIVGCATWFDGSREKSADIYLQLGIRYLNMNRLDVAKENLEKVLAQDSNNVQAHNALAFLYEKIEKFADAKIHYEAALRLTPDDLGVQNNFGRFLCKHGQAERGMALLNQAIGNLLNDRQWLALTNAGLCQMDMGQKQMAKTYFKQALLANNAYAPALLEMQKLSFQNGEYWPAKGYLQRYLGVAEHTAESLWYGMQTEQALGNVEEAGKYQNLLLEKFPLSNEAKKLNR